MIQQIAAAIRRLSPDHPLRVAIDGVDAAGKTTLADELARAIAAAGRPVIRATIDRFHNPRRIRYHRGRSSPEGYYRDSFDISALVSLLLDPLGPGGSRRYAVASFDDQREAPIEPAWTPAQSNAILLFDGVFLTIPALRRHWDFVLFVDVSPATSLARGVARDAARIGGPDRAQALYRERYLPGQALYASECDPRGLADAVVFNDDPGTPRIRWRSRRS
jgi:uridine kinase